MALIPDAPDFDDLGLTDQDAVYLDAKEFEEAHDPRLRFYREYLKDKPAWTFQEVELLVDDANGLEMTSMDAYQNQVPVVEWAKRYYEKAESVKRAVAAGELQPCPSQHDHFLPSIAVEWLLRRGVDLHPELAAIATGKPATAAHQPISTRETKHDPRAVTEFYNDLRKNDYNHKQAETQTLIHFEISDRTLRKYRQLSRENLR